MLINSIIIGKRTPLVQSKPILVLDILGRWITKRFLNISSQIVQTFRRRLIFLGKTHKVSHHVACPSTKMTLGGNCPLTTFKDDPGIRKSGYGWHHRALTYFSLSKGLTFKANGYWPLWPSPSGLAWVRTQPTVSHSLSYQMSYEVCHLEAKALCVMRVPYVIFWVTFVTFNLP